MWRCTLSLGFCNQPALPPIAPDFQIFLLKNPMIFGIGIASCAISSFVRLADTTTNKVRI